MQITQSGKKTFLQSGQPRPSQKLSKSLQKFYTNKIKQVSGSTEDVQPTQTLRKIAKNPSFQYYFYTKVNSSKNLHKLRNSDSTKKLLQSQRRKSMKLDQQISQKQKQLMVQENAEDSDNVPFYQKYRPTAIQNDPVLADYGINYPKRSLKQKKLSHNFQKIIQNKQNINKYRGTQGMVSPQKLRTQNNEKTQHQVNIQPNYNLTLSPFQFKNTIEGSLKTKSSRNIRMDLNKTQKINNVHKLWYNTDAQTEKIIEDFHKIRKSVEYEQKLKKCHSFDSYKGHKLFESRLKKTKVPADEAFYDSKGDAKNMDFYKRWKTQNHLKMQKTTDRPKLPQKLGTNLEYNLYGQNIINPSTMKSPQVKGKCKMGISSSQRNLVFSRQVINNSRGCYR